MTTIEPLLTIKDIMQLTSFSRSTLYRMLEAREFPAPRKIGRSIRWPAAVVRQWIEDLQHTSTAPAS